MTPERQKKIEEAAEKLGHQQFDSWPASLERQAHINQTISDFKSGAEYVLSHPELMREELMNFTKWIKDTYLTGSIGKILIDAYLNSKTQNNEPGT